MVDRVVLEALEQPGQMRELERRGAAVARAGCATPATKSFRSGTCASTLLPSTRSAFRPSSDQALARARRRRSRRACRHAALLRRRGDVGGRIDPEHRNALAARSAGAGSRRSRRARPRGCRTSARAAPRSSRRSVRACSTHESEKAEKYAYSSKISQARRRPAAARASSARTLGRAADRTAPSSRAGRP